MSTALTPRPRLSLDHSVSPLEVSVVSTPQLVRTVPSTFPHLPASASPRPRSSPPCTRVSSSSRKRKTSLHEQAKSKLIENKEINNVKEDPEMSRLHLLYIEKIVKVC